MGSKNNSKIAVENSGPIKVLLWGASLTTLALWTTFQDPFNPLKFSMILITASWLTGHLFLAREIFSTVKQLKITLLIIILFLVFYLISAMFTDNRRTAFIGDNQRYNGVLMYIGLAVVMLAAAKFVRNSHGIKIIYVSSLLGIILSIYGLLQINGIDFVKWNNPYNSVISTVGNPNFAAAIIAILAILSFAPVLNNSFNFFFRILGVFVALLSILAIYLSDARQGLISFAIGIGFYSIIWIHLRNKIMGYIAAGIGAIIGLISIFGMLQIGPLTSLLYKGSVTVRGYYWRAGIEMLQSHPWFGVGVDRYGAYFKQYREVGYPLNYGFDITSTNAHNVPIQFFATAGVFVGSMYLFLLAYILYCGLKGIKQKKGNDRLILASIFSAWLAYQAQSVISIDSPGIAVWGWLLGGAIIGLSIKDDEQLNKLPGIKQGSNKQLSIGLKQPIISTSLLIITLIFSAFLFKGESSMYKTRSVYNPDAPQNGPYLKQAALDTIDIPFINPIYTITSASFLANSGFPKEGIGELEKIANSDSRSDDALDLLATYYYQLGNIESAIEKRKQISLLDPWDAKNYFTLGQLYKISGDVENMKKIQAKIISFASNTPEGEKAKLELVP
jgi:O-antigen ligase